MKKVSVAVTKQSGNIPQTILTIGLDLGDRNSWYSCWMKPARYNGSNASVRLRKRCAKCSAEWRAAGWRWKPGRIHPGSVNF